MQGHSFPVSACRRVAFLLALVFITEPPHVFSQTSAQPAPASLPMCWYACTSHCGEVVQCMGDKGRPAAVTCASCTAVPAQPLAGLTSPETATPSPCAGLGRFLRLYPGNPHYLQDAVTLEPVLIASYTTMA